MIGEITNGESGISVRQKLNQVIFKLNSAAAPNWADITNKPLTFPSAAPNWADIIGKPLTFPSAAPNWADITDKPLGLNTWNKVLAGVNTELTGTTQTNISGLSFDIEADRFYEIKIWIKIQSTPNNGGVRWSSAAPLLTLGRMALTTSQNPTSVTNLGINSTSGTMPAQNAMPALLILFGEAKIFAVSAGIFSMRFAQSTNNPNPIIALSDSFLEWRQI